MPRYVGRHRPYEGRHRPPAAAARSTSGAGSALFRGPRNMLRPALAGGLAITMAEAQDVVPAKPGAGVALTADPADQNSAALAAAGVVNREGASVSREELRTSITTDAKTIAVQAVKSRTTITAKAQAAAKAKAAAEAKRKREAAAAAKAKAIAQAKADPVAAARAIMPEFGWSSEGQMSCLVTLWTRESNWRWYAENPYSGAYGIPQSLPASKMASVGADYRTNPVTQIRWGLQYIRAAYGSPCNALGAWNSRYPHWY